MRHGLDTCFLIAFEAASHSQHTAVHALVRQCLSSGDDFALAPQVLAELVHVLTDQRRFAQPLSMAAAKSGCQSALPLDCTLKKVQIFRLRSSRSNAPTFGPQRLRASKRIGPPPRRRVYQNLALRKRPAPDRTDLPYRQPPA